MGLSVFFFNDAAPTGIYTGEDTLSLHALFRSYWDYKIQMLLINQSHQKCNQSSYSSILIISQLCVQWPKFHSILVLLLIGYISLVAPAPVQKYEKKPNMF